MNLLNLDRYVGDPEAPIYCNRWYMPQFHIFGIGRLSATKVKTIPIGFTPGISWKYHQNVFYEVD
jgi:hypothetical protein